MNENDMPRWIHEEAERRDAEVTRKLEEYYMELGESYMKGEGVEKNEEEAQEWFRKAAELKSKDAAAPSRTLRHTSDFHHLQSSSCSPQ